MECIKILIPVYNDWQAFDLLFEKIKNSFDKASFQNISFTVIDDCSTIPSEQSKYIFLEKMELVLLNRNVGHQRAITIGLAYIAEHEKVDAVIVMDADGEDKPEDINKLLHASQNKPGHIVFAKRTKRMEGILFQIFYSLYKIIFFILTGKKISFGNFCIVPGAVLTKLVYVSEIWNHFSSGVMRSKIEYKSIPLSRGKRLAGESKLNFTDLIIHGLSAISVYTDIVAARLLIASTFLIASSIVGIAIVLGLKFLTNLAVPGWATSALTGLFIILMQAFMISLLLTFIVLVYRTQKLFIPAIHYKDYILEIKKCK